MPIRQMIVAVVDDDPGMLKALERLLRAHGFRVEASLSAEAFLAGGALGYADCLLLDIHLSQMSGLELRRQLTSSGCTIPVIFITAVDDKSIRQEALKTGCVDFLRKPLSSDLLFAAIQKALG